MKISLALGPRHGLSRQTALGCLTTNLALPGFGSLLGGRRAGYLQAALSIAAVALTSIFGVRFVIWALANWARLHDPQAEPFEALLEMWLAVRWPFLGIGIFALSWIWALATSMEILRSARREQEAAAAPPKL